MVRWWGALGLFLILCGKPAMAQFLRVGPFDFYGSADLEGVYSSNVEQERPSEATAERTDYYYVVGLDLSSKATLAPRTTLSLKTGISVEQHEKRPDLNNSSNPFGLLELSSMTELGHYTLNLDASYERTSESADDKYVPGGRKKRDVSDKYDFAVDLEWKREALKFGLGYSFSRERHDDEEFKDGDEDEYKLTFSALWNMTRRVSLSYDYEHDKDITVNDPECYKGWDDKHNIGLEFMLLERPNLTYTFGYEKEEDEGEPGEWEQTHTLMVADSWEFSRTLRASLNASYKHEEQEESNDVAFQYGGMLEHDISRTARHILSVSQEPVDTLGSTADTKKTTVGYLFTKSDLFIYNLNLTAGVTYERDVPKEEGETEKKWTYDVSLEYVRALTRKLQRTLEYAYHREDSNLEDEILDEHRVTLSFDYTF